MKKLIHLLILLSIILIQGCNKIFFDSPTTGPTVDPIIFPDHFLFGQPDYGFSAVNNGGASGVRLNQPEALWFDGTRVYLCDRDNARLLIWNTYQKFLAGPTALNNAPDVVLQQPDFNTVGGATTRLKMSTCRGVLTVGNKLLVSDFNNNRVLVWNSIPTINNTQPDFVLGQTDFTTSAGGTTASKFSGPFGLAYQGNKLYVADRLNNRVLVWNSFPTYSGEPASYALGQPDMVTNSCSAISASNFCQPISVKFQNGAMYLSDWARKRILVWDTIPTTYGVDADYVLGQPNLTASGTNNPNLSASSLAGVFTMHVDSTGLFVPDYGNNRLLHFTLPITQDAQPADWEIGQSSFTAVSPAGPAETETNGIISVIQIGDHFVMSDQDNNRLISDLYQSKAP